MASPLAVLADADNAFIAERDPVALLDMASRTIREEAGAALAIAAIFDESSARPASVLTSGSIGGSEHLRAAEVAEHFVRRPAAAA